MAYLCSRALAADIEPEHCRALIAAHRLAPPEAYRFADHWPYPLKIGTLGRFTLMKNGQPLRFEGKPQRKPLELLKALIALGGRDVRDGRLSDILWPDAAGDAAHSAFSTTLARLRKLLGGDDSVVVQDGRVSLDPRHCWLDTWAMEARIVAVEGAPVAVGAATPVLDLYRGAFLEQESDAAWVLPARERLRSRFLRFLTHEARRLGEAGHREQVVTLYLQGLEIDPLIEDFHRGLMTAYGGLGRPAEALACFERCCALLAKTLGVQPGAETRALAERLRQA
jgi:DNA-binding SARP family transcriptional activator